MTVPQITNFSDAPNPDDGPTVFDADMRTFFTELGTFVTEANTQASYSNTQAAASAASATAAASSATDAATSATAAATSASTAATEVAAASASTIAAAQAYAEQAAAAAGAVAWVSGSDQSAGDLVISPSDGAVYRAVSDVTGGTTDPASDATNFEEFLPSLAFGMRSFATYADLMASDFSALASEDDLVYVRDIGATYQVAASGATDQHLTTAGGVKLYALPTAGMMDIRAFGATGGADDTTAIAAALATGADVFIPAGEWICSAISPSADHQTIAGVGLASVLKFKAGETGVMFDSDGHPVTLRDLDFDGQDNGGKGSGALAEPGEGDADDRSGLALDFDTDTRVLNVNVHGFGNRGLKPRNASGNRNGGFEVIGGKYSLNWCNIEAGPGLAEYCRFVGISCTSGQIGIRTSSGNQTFTACTFNDNYKNVHLTGDGIGNDSHGSMIGCLMNHGGLWCLHAEEVSVGFVFSGCQMHDGAIELENCDGVQIVHGEFDVSTITVTNCGAGRIEGNYCFGTETNSLIFTGSDEFILRENYKTDGSLIARGLTTLGDSDYTAGDIGVLRIGENGAIDSYGFEFSTSGASGDMKLWAVGSTAAGAGNRDATPALTASRTSGKITGLTASFTSAADDTAAAAAGVPVGGLYQNAGAVRQRLT